MRQHILVRQTFTPEEIEKRIALFEATYNAEPDWRFGRCATCRHEKRQEIHRMSLEGKMTWKDIAAWAGMKRETLRSHHKYHFTPIVAGDPEKKKSFINALGAQRFPHRATFEKKREWLIKQQEIRQRVALININAKSNEIQAAGLKELAECTREIREIMKMRPPPREESTRPSEAEGVDLERDHADTVADAAKRLQEKEHGNAGTTAAGGSAGVNGGAAGPDTNLRASAAGANGSAAEARL